MANAGYKLAAVIIVVLFIVGYIYVSRDANPQEEGKFVEYDFSLKVIPTNTTPSIFITFISISGVRMKC